MHEAHVYPFRPLPPIRTDDRPIPFYQPMEYLMDWPDRLRELFSREARKDGTYNLGCSVNKTERPYSQPYRVHAS
ncbi:hypothetical protein ACRALDRAFT_212792 [Sodiomyces alcalophilus JCM 7366]|uniref:uncharacterized protein n=1 Tax=Sodiomyces alcalophilus JCM 7366 TaxID=591952 RepID=UPI0039B69182